MCYEQSTVSLAAATSSDALSRCQLPPYLFLLEPPHLYQIISHSSAYLSLFFMIAFNCSFHSLKVLPIALHLPLFPKLFHTHLKQKRVSNQQTRQLNTTLAQPIPAAFTQSVQQRLGLKQQSELHLCQAGRLKPTNLD